MKPTEYEQFVQQVIQELTETKGIVVHRQKAYVGKITQRKIVVDVSFEATILGERLLFLLECKHYNHRVPVNDVEEFHSKLDDIGAHKGIIFTTLGFQDGAVKVAKAREIGLVLLTPDRQPGELMFVANSATTSRPLIDRCALLQGNAKVDVKLDFFERGLRFDSGQELVGLAIRNTPHYYNILKEKR